MKYQAVTILFTLLIILSSCSGRKIEKTNIQSPDGKIKIEFSISSGEFSYEVFNDGNVIISKSLLGLKLKDETISGESFSINNIETNSFNETWEQPWGEKRLIENRYEEMKINCKGRRNKIKEISITFRAYNDGIGFRYEIPSQSNIDSLIVMDEITEFNLPESDYAWWTPAYSGVYYENITRHTPVNEIDTANLPLTIETLNGKYLAIHEANLTDYPAMNLYCIGQSTLKSDLTPWSTGEKAFIKVPFQSPWRMVIIANKPGDLITSNLELNLNEPCKIEDTSWIKPGKYIGIWWGMHMEKYSWNIGPKHGATTSNTMKYIDFASKYGFDGVLVEGWNTGWENDWTKEGYKFSFTTPYPDFDIEKIVKYAQEKGVKLIGHHETGGSTINYENQMEEAFKMYNNLGVNAVKTGYVSPRLDGKERHSSQYGVRHFRKVVETAAKYKIMIDNHEPVMPTGLRRTFPNLMTGEGMRGQEYNAWSDDGGNPTDHTTIIPFTRGLAGPMDYTPGVFNFTNSAKPKTRVKTTLAHQLALYVVLYSPLQMACDLPENYEGNPSFKFITDVPVNWDITKIIDSKIGDFIITARKDRDTGEWFIGAITDENSRDISVPLNFLNNNTEYKAQIYVDGERADFLNNPTDVSIYEQKINSTTTLNLKLAKGGGAAIRIRPAN